MRIGRQVRAQGAPVQMQPNQIVPPRVMHARTGQRRQRGHDPRDRARTTVDTYKAAWARNFGLGLD